MYPHQAERLQGALERQRLDALIAASPANVAYVTGFSSLARRVYPMLETYAVVTRDATALVVPTIEASVRNSSVAPRAAASGAINFSAGGSAPRPH